MKSKGVKFIGSTMASAATGLSGNTNRQSRQTGANALAAGPLDQMRNMFGQSKQPTTGAMGAMDQANSQSLMGQDKIGCSDGMMAKSPLKSSAGAYENPTTASEPSGGDITAAVDGAVENATSSLMTSDGQNNDPVKVNNPAKQARIDGRNERKLIRQTHRSKKTIIKNEKKKNNLIERLG
tara:strand:+ start:1036 stop:1578 length:543 start_codon:yes stop_codon:yes gene_type:complete